MKVRTIALLLPVIFFSAGLAGAQTPPPPSPAPVGSPAGSPSDHPGDGSRRKIWESLPPEVKKRLDEAKNKALQDPTIQDLKKKSDEATHAFLDAMRVKMQEIDPSLADLLKKKMFSNMMGGHSSNQMPGSHNPSSPGGNNPPAPGASPGTAGANPPHGGHPPGPGGGPGGHGKLPEFGGMSGLSDSDRQKVMAARAKVKSDPDVQTAKEQMKAATTPADHQIAEKKYQQAMFDAIVKMDPTMEPILKKLTPPAPVAKPSPAGDMMMSQ